MNYRRVSVRPILSMLLILALLCAVLTLTACSDKIDAVAIEVVKDTIPDVATVGAFDLSQLKLKVSGADGSEQEIAITLSMLDTASKNSLKEPGEKNINVYYQKKATTFTIFLVEEGTKTVSVTFLAQDSTVLAKKYAVAGNAIEAPQAPSIDGLVFDSWRNRDNSQEISFSSVSSDLVVYAHYTENAIRYTVKFYDYNNKLVETYENIPHNSTITAPSWSRPSAIKSHSWNWDFINQRVTQNTSIYMTVEYNTCDISFQYTYSESGRKYDLFTKKSVNQGQKLGDKDLQDAIDEMASKNIEWVRWLNADKLTTNTARTFTIIALVKSYTYAVEFVDQDQGKALINSGESYTMPQSARHKDGYEFAGQWKDKATGNTYTAGVAYPINSHLTLNAVYTKVLENVKFTFNFEDLIDDEGQPLSLQDTDTVSSIDVDAVYLDELLIKLKQENTDKEIENFAIKSFEKQGDDYIITCGDATKWLSYHLNGDSYIVSAYSPSTDPTILLNINIPDMHDDKPVVSIADGVFSASVQGHSLNINSLTLPTSLLTIGNNAFSGASFLMGAVVLPDSVKTIGQGAFADCQDLITINLDQVTNIAESAFDNCASLSNVGSLDNVVSIADFAFRATALTSVSLAGLTDMGTQVFLLTEKLTDLAIATSASGDITFDFANIMGSGVKSLVLGKGVTALSNTIGEKFVEIDTINATSVYAMSKLTALSFAKELENIDVATFNLFPRIKTITVAAESGYAVDNYALFKSDALIYYPSGIFGDYTVPLAVNGVEITQIAKDAFIVANIYKLVLQENIAEVGATNCARLSLVEMSLATLEVLFGQSVELTPDITVDDILNNLDTKFTQDVTYFINNYDALEQSGKDKLDALVSHESQRFIVELSAASSYFDEPNGLLYTVYDDIATIVGGDRTATTITIPATLGGYTVSHIKDGTFNGYADLKELHIEATLDNLNLSSDTFAACVSLEKITLAGLTNLDTINYNLFDETKLYQENAIIVLAGVPVAYNADFTSIKESHLAGATIIPKEFFKNSTDLVEITLPNSIVEIKDNAFSGCESLTTINLKAVTKTGQYVFENCTSLQSVVIPLAINGGKVSVGMFSGCTSLTSVSMDKVNGFAHKNGKSYAFSGCESLTDISFLYNFQGIIYEHAFDGCSSIASVNLTIDALGNNTSKFTEIRANAFANNTNLVYLEINEKVTVLGEKAFYNTALNTVRIKGAGGIFAKGQTIQVGVFPADVTLYIDNLDTNIVSVVLHNYRDNYKTAEPRINFEMLSGFSAGSNQLNMSEVSASYMEKAPQARTFDDYVFVSWFVELGGENVKAEFPMAFDADTTLYAKYYSIYRGSVIDSDLELIEGEHYRLIGYSSQDSIAYIPYKYTNDAGEEWLIQEIDLSVFKGKTNITSLVIPEGVTTLKDKLVDSAISYIKIASSVTDIIDDAFSGMDNLDIEWAANSKLVNASLSAFVGSKWYKDASDKAKTGFNNRFVIAGGLAIEFMPAGDTVKVIVVPNGVTKLNDNLFPLAQSSLYTAITTVTLNDNLSAIGNYCFAGLTNVVTFNYQSTADKSAIDKVVLNAFPTHWTSKQNQVIIGKIFLKYFGLYFVDTFNLPEHITTIAPNAFANARIEEIKFAGNKVTTIGNYAFKESTLQSIVLPSSVTAMGDGVFQGCKDLESADLTAAKIKALPTATFADCTNLWELRLGDNVTKIANNSLKSCTRLNVIVANGIADTEGLVPDGIASTAWYNIKPEKGTHLVLGKVYVKYIVGSNPVLNDDGLIEVTVPSGVEIILAEAFMGISNLGKVTIASTVRTIESNAFKDSTGLKSIVIDSSSQLETIGDGAFSKTSSLNTIELPESLQTIGDNAFDGSRLKSIVIPEAVTTIGERAFADNYLETVKLGKGLVHIGSKAFAGNELLYKVEWGLDVVEMDNEIDKETNVDTVKQLYEMYKSSKNADGEYTLTALDVDKIFLRTNTTAIRLYIPNDAFLMMNSGLYNYLSIWVDSNNKYFEIIREGQLPEVTFDQNGYIMQKSHTEYIEVLPKPSKTNHTFKYWQVDGTQVTFPYHVKGDVEFVAVWESNAKSNADLQGDGSIDGISYDVNIVGGDVVSYTITGINEELSVVYVPSTLDSLPIVGFDLVPGSVDHVERIIFTKASNFFRIDTNIFAVFSNLASVELLDSNMSNVNYKVENGAMYSVDGKELVAYFIQRASDGKIITDFAIPSGVVKILSNAFTNSGLESITIPSTVTSIGVHAFNDAMDNITFVSNTYLTEVNSASLENTNWYQEKSWNNYEFNGSAVGKFYAAANILLAYHEQSQTHTLELPDTVNDFAITVLASGLSSNYDRENPRETAYELIVLPAGLKKINSGSFVGIDALNFDGEKCADTLVDIADDAFGEDSEYLKNTNSDDGMLVLGKVLLRYKNSQPELNLATHDKTKNIITIAKQAFHGTQFSKITLPNTLMYIADEAFFSNTNLYEINIPASVKSIGTSAFQYCTGLNKITFAENSAIEYIGGNSFADCYNLKSINVPHTVTTIGDSAFEGCMTLETVVFEKQVVDNVEINALTSLGASAFQGCEALTSISIPNGLTEIKESTFNGCISLVNVLFETDKSKVKFIRKEAFAGCVSLGSIINVDNPSLITLELPNALTHVEDNAFTGCTGLYGVAFSYHIDTIGKEVFLDCLKLTRIDMFADNAPTLGENALMRARPASELQPYYNLRIYVRRDSNDKIYGDYMHYWAEYKDNVFKQGDYASLSYLYSEPGFELPLVVEPKNTLKDVYINPKYTFSNKVEVTSWVFDQIDGGNTDIYGASRDKQGLADYQSQHNPVTSTSDIILVLDYDIVITNASG